MTTPYAPETHTRAQIDQLRGPAVVDFGTNWCGYCQAARPLVDQAFGAHPDVAHLKVEDGSGRALGRSFGVKLWPTLVFLRDGQEVARLVRPTDTAAIEAALARLTAVSET
jgi:thioredoxin 1